jgi:uncharacterized protein YdeI (YjbR/CyaY-like superfamily)
MNPKVDFYFHKAKTWQKEIEQLRSIVLDCGLQEELKWGSPCYTLGKANIVLIHVFKEYCALLFFKGALLHDTHGILVQQTKNVQAARQIRFTNAEGDHKIESVLKAYIYEAIEIEKAGLKVDTEKKPNSQCLEEFQKKLNKKLALKTAFYALTPGSSKSIPSLFFRSQTIANTGSTD